MFSFYLNIVYPLDYGRLLVSLRDNYIQSGFTNLWVYPPKSLFSISLHPPMENWANWMKEWQSRHFIPKSKDVGSIQSFFLKYKYVRFSWNETFINIAINNFISYWLEWTMECLVQPCCWSKLWMTFFIPCMQSSVSYKSPCSWGCLAVFSHRSIFPASGSDLSFIISTELAKARGSNSETLPFCQVERIRHFEDGKIKGHVKIKSLFQSVKHSEKEKKGPLHSPYQKKTEYELNQ